jgi:arylsulfatase A-like enzyme
MPLQSFLQNLTHTTLGCAGHPVVSTPNIDRLAAEGVRFDSCYTSCPACMPARATLFSGLSMRVNGCRVNGANMRRDLDTLPGLLANAGYATYAAGKLHLRTTPGPDLSPEKYPDIYAEPSRHPEISELWDAGLITETAGDYYGLQHIALLDRHGFPANDYAAWLKATNPGVLESCYLPLPDPYIMPDGRYPWYVSGIPEECHYNRWIADRTIAYMRGHEESDQPFFIWCSFPDPHSPMAAVKKWSDFYQDADFPLPEHDEEIDLDTIPETLIDYMGGREEFKKTVYKNGGAANLRNLYIQYFGMISHIDEQVGRVLQQLEASGLADDTVVGFVSDHGDQMGEHGLMHKCAWPYDGNARVPFILKVPGGCRGKTVDTVVSLFDFMPTVLDLADVAQPEDPRYSARYEAYCRGNVPAALPGESLKPTLLTGAPPSRGSALFEFDDEWECARHDLVQMRTLVVDDWKLCHYSPTGELVLFDRRRDPLEKHNLARDPAYAALVTELLSRLLVEVARTDSRLPRRIVGA